MGVRYPFVCFLVIPKKNGILRDMYGVEARSRVAVALLRFISEVHWA